MSTFCLVIFYLSLLGVLAYSLVFVIPAVLALMFYVMSDILDDER
jgi:hypothetical protein